VGAPKRAFRARLPPILTVCSLRIGYLKIDVSCEASVNFQHISQIATPATESSENVAKVLRLPRKTIFDTLQNTSECHEVPRLPRETKQRHIGHLQK